MRTTEPCHARRAAGALAALVVLLLAPPVGAQPRALPALPELDTIALDSTLRAEMRESRAPGAAIAVVVGDRVAFARGYGATSTEGGVPVTPATLFRIGSTTKMFTGMTALRLAEAGRLSLARPIGEYAEGLGAALRPVTLHQLLTHTAGLVNLAAGDGPHDPPALGARVRTWRADELFAQPGAVYSYSGPGYWLAGYAIEQAGGRWFDELVDSLVLAPVGMTRSTFRPHEALTHPLALDHRVGPDGVARVVRPFPDDVTTWASGSLFSSAEELARFAIALLNDGRVEGAPALPPAAVRAILAPKAPIPGGDCAYTYGLQSCAERGTRVVSHAGFRGGTGSIVTLVPQHGVAVIVLANRNGGIFARTAERALDLLLPSTVAAAARAADATAPTARTFDAAARRRLAGTYVNGADTLRLVERDGTLAYRYASQESATRPGPGGEVLVLDAQGRAAQRFFTVPERGEVRFLHDGMNAFRRMP